MPPLSWKLLVALKFMKIEQPPGILLTNFAPIFIQKLRVRAIHKCLLYLNEYGIIYELKWFWIHK